MGPLAYETSVTVSSEFYKISQFLPLFSSLFLLTQSLRLKVSLNQLISLALFIWVKVSNDHGLVPYLSRTDQIYTSHIFFLFSFSKVNETQRISIAQLTKKLFSVASDFENISSIALLILRIIYIFFDFFQDLERKTFKKISPVNLFINNVALVYNNVVANVSSNLQILKKKLCEKILSNLEMITILHLV